MANTLKACFLAALVSGSALLSACTAANTDRDQENITTPADNQNAAVTTKHDPNVPDHVVVSDITPNHGDTPSSQNPAPAVTAPPVSIPAQDGTQTNAKGEIIDDWQSGLSFNNKGNTDALYAEYGIDRNAREGYYRMISSECAFPIVHVSTKNNAEILSLDDYVDCFVEVFNCDDIYELNAARAGIKVRGNASAHYGDVGAIRSDGAPYRIKFDEKQSMLGLNDFARCRSWVLLRTFDTGIRDHLAFNIARAVNGGDYYVSDSQLVQLYVNEKYKGLYLLCEQTQENSERIDINEAENGYTGTDIGYLVELDNYAEGDDDPYFYLVYDREEITDVYGTSRVPRKYAYSVKNDLYSDEQLKFIERYFEVAWTVSKRAIVNGQYYKVDENFELIPAHDEFRSAYECISAVFDIQSVVDMYIAYEIVNDQDVGGGSFFFAVDFGEGSKYTRLTMVAPWDFDWGYTDYNSTSDGGLYAAKFKDNHFVESFGDRSNPWLILFYSADWFRDLVKQTWRERLPYINAAISEVENTVVNFADDFNKDIRRSGRAITTVHWARDRVDYLNSLWG